MSVKYALQKLEFEKHVRPWAKYNRIIFVCLFLISALSMGGLSWEAQVNLGVIKARVVQAKEQRSRQLKRIQGFSGVKELIGVVPRAQALELRGFFSYVGYLVRFDLPKLWINEISLAFPKSFLLSGASLDPLSIQRFSGYITGRGPYRGSGMRLAEFTGLLKLSEREKKQVQNLKKKARSAKIKERLMGLRSRERKTDIEVEKIKLEKTYTFLMTNWSKLDIEDYQALKRGDKPKKRKKKKAGRRR
jgi:hypothetical protein